MLGLSLPKPGANEETKAPSFLKQLVRSPSSSERVAELTNLQGCIDVVIDTCADATVVPDKVFSMIRKTIEVEFGRDRVDGTGKAPSTKSRKLAAYVDAKGWIWFRRSVIERLPVVAVQVHAASSFEVRLSNRVQVCDGG
ncbi:hypothetical protein FOZ61_008501 [Perkinsus olseni]|uniref:Uncharacterized protein n=1 Tax=Perkinsus olseni TaxID=32597 RepID=A0A7J6L4B8_PEROL|nr:hypothetical protein FOZ61_008501 [Perkinsus olseni]